MDKVKCINYYHDNYKKKTVVTRIVYGTVKKWCTDRTGAIVALQTGDYEYFKINQIKDANHWTMPADYITEER